MVLGQEPEAYAAAFTVEIETGVGHLKEEFQVPEQLCCKGLLTFAASNFR